MGFVCHGFDLSSLLQYFCHDFFPSFQKGKFFSTTGSHELLLNKTYKMVAVQKPIASTDCKLDTHLLSDIDVSLITKVSSKIKHGESPLPSAKSSSIIDLLFSINKFTQNIQTGFIASSKNVRS